MKETRLRARLHRSWRCVARWCLLLYKPQASTAPSLFHLSHLVFLPPHLSPTWAVCFLSLLELLSQLAPILVWCCPVSFLVTPLVSAFFVHFASSSHLAQVTSATLCHLLDRLRYAQCPIFLLLFAPWLAASLLRCTGGPWRRAPLIPSLPSLPGVSYSRKAALLLACSTWVDCR